MTLETLPMTQRVREPRLLKRKQRSNSLYLSGADIHRKVNTTSTVHVTWRKKHIVDRQHELWATRFDLNPHRYRSKQKQRNFQYFRVGTEPVTSRANCQEVGGGACRVDTTWEKPMGEQMWETMGGAAETAGTRGNGQQDGSKRNMSDSLCNRM